MKEITYEDWQENPTPREMWVWDDYEEDKKKRKIIYISKETYPETYPVVSVTLDDKHVERYGHCAEIEKQRRMTNKELARWLREKPTREYKNTNNSCPIVYSEYTYLENESSDKADINILIREDDGEWREPLVEVEE